MPITLPLEGKWSQPNNSDKFGSIWASKNINLDEEGYLKLSPRTILLADEVENSDFGVPVFIGRFATGDYLVATSSDAVFNVRQRETVKSNTENSGSGEPTLSTDSFGVFWQNLFVVSGGGTGNVYSRAVSSDAAAAWTTRITGLSGTQFPLSVFQSRQTLCVGATNQVKQYNTSWTDTTITLTIPADFRVVGLAYNNQKMGVITRLGSATQGQSAEAYFFLWDGATTGAQASAGVGSDACLAVVPYRGSFVVLTRAGQLLYWNGGGFDILSNFPFWYEEKHLHAGGNNDIFLNHLPRGNIMWVEGDVIYINMPSLVQLFGRKSEQVMVNFPHGVWCFDPKVGLYHRWSASRSKEYRHSIASANINTSTDTFTTSGTIPNTGGVVRYIETTSGDPGTLGGLTLLQDYFVIKLTGTTFQLATSRANAFAGTAVDITSATGTHTFWMYDLMDYGTSLSKSETGAVVPVGESSLLRSDIMFGGEYYDTSLAAKDSLCIAVPELESRGWFITPKIFSSQVIDTAQKLFLKFRPLKSGDSVLVKYRNKEVAGLPVSSTGNPDLNDLSATWTADNKFTTTQDLSEAKTHFDASGKLECELIAGAGAGSIEQITALTESSGAYTVTLENDILGVEQGRKSEFIINNWELKRTITSSDDSPVEVPIGGRASWSQFKIELRGSEIALDKVQFISAVDKQSI